MLTSSCRRKQLIPVNFIYETPSGRPSASVESTPATESGEKSKKDEPLNSICPSCKKNFSNTTLMFCTSAVLVQLLHTLMAPEC